MVNNENKDKATGNVGRETLKKIYPFLDETLGSHIWTKESAQEQPNSPYLRDVFIFITTIYCILTNDY